MVLQRRPSGEVLTLFLSGIEDLDKYFSEFFPQIIYACAVPVIFLSFIFPVDPLSGLILLVTAPLIPLFMILIGNRAEKVTQDQWDQFSKLGGYYLDSLRGLVTLKILNQGKAYSKILEHLNEDYQQATMNVLRISFLSAFVLEIIATISTAVIAVEIGLRLLYGSFSFQTAFFILLLVPEYFLPLRQLSLKFHASSRGLAASVRIFEFLGLEEWNENPVTVSIDVPETSSDLKNMVENSLVIRFNNVGYTYPQRDIPAVADLTFQINNGQHVAVVGDSGSGKSTLVNLLLRFIDPDQGDISINGLPLSNIPVSHWLSEIAYVPQFPYIRSGTVENNIQMDSSNKDAARIWKAIEAAQLGEWVSSLPLGIHTRVGEDGFRLSSGEAQRLVIARALYRNSQIVIMDEPTSAIDPETEMYLQTAQKLLSAGKTVITIAHRLPTIVEADLILVLKAGRLVEQGKHQSLLGNGGDYFRFIKASGVAL